MPDTLKFSCSNTTLIFRSLVIYTTLTVADYATNSKIIEDVITTRNSYQQISNWINDNAIQAIIIIIFNTFVIIPCSVWEPELE